MRNLPNVYCSFSPGMPILNGVPGSFIDVLKKVLITGSDPVAFLSVKVLDGVATVETDVEDAVYFNGCTINLTGCDEPLLNGEHYIEEHTKYKFSFNTTVADGDYIGDIRINLIGAGWQLLFTGTNEAVFTSGNLDSIGVCIKVIDTNALYATLEFYENMTSLTSGTNKFNPSMFGANRVVRFFKSYYATANKVNYWLVADNTTVHISNERIYSSVNYTHSFDGFRGNVITSFGEMLAKDDYNKKHFYYIGYNADINSGSYYTNHDSNSIGISYSSDTLSNSDCINGCLLTQSDESVWKRFSVSATNRNYIHGRISGSLSRLNQDFNMLPYYYIGQYFSTYIETYNNVGVSFFGKLKETFYLDQKVSGLIRNLDKITVNNKKYIMLPTYRGSSPTGSFEINSYIPGMMGMVPFLIGEKWED